MQYRKLTLWLACFTMSFLFGQSEDPVLFTIDQDEVNSSEFVRVYEKNKDLVVDQQDKDFDDYFELFVDFKLKLRQARDLHLDTLSSYVEELEKYREQLIQPYLKNPEALDALVQEAYERTLYEVNASHILVMVAPDASPQDTMRAYQKIEAARKELAEGGDFVHVANKFSEDPSVKRNGGELGYFSAFAMVYPFENAAYKTEVGEISMPFRTDFGYHILKVNDKRLSHGEVQVGHIMVAKDSADLTGPKEKIQDIYNKLLQGDDFASIAREHSDDQSSSAKGGVLPKFSTGRMIKPFEEVAFSLPSEGSFSEPFETEYGWHILKLLKKYPVESFETLKPGLESKIKSGSRSTYVERDLAERIAKNYQIEEDRAFIGMQSNLKSFEGKEHMILKVNESTYSADEFYQFSSKQKPKSVLELFDEFKNAKVISYYKDHLEQNNREFALTYAEYRDGLLLFELLQQEVWNKAERDTTGMVHYFEENREKYAWKKRARLTIASCTRLEKAEQVRMMLLDGFEIDSIKEAVNEGATIHVLFSKGTLQEGSSKLPEGYDMKVGVSKIFEDKRNQFTIVRTDEIFPPSEKELMEARGEVISDYQNHLEKIWVDQLRNTYTVRVNKKNYDKLKAQLENL